MDEQNIDVLDTITSENIGNVKLLDEELFNIENKLKNKLDQGLSPTEYKNFDALYKATVESRELLNSLFS